MTFQGKYRAGQNLNVDGVFVSFETTFSDPNSTVEWLADDPTEISADTLGFLVGPSTTTIKARARRARQAGRQSGHAELRATSRPACSASSSAGWT
ncbi:MAG: hypothetical protein R3D98_08750 [Candidatus Krumholzibacteriia bacterium]